MNCKYCGSRLYFCTGFLRKRHVGTFVACTGCDFNSYRKTLVDGSSARVENVPRNGVFVTITIREGSHGTDDEKLRGDRR